MATLDIGEVRRRLEAERAEIAAPLEAIRSRLSVSQGESGGEISLADQHPADAASETESRELDMTRQVMFESRLKRIDAALQRIAAGTYGRCVVCGEPIAAERLEILPETPYCVKDAAREERV